MSEFTVNDRRLFSKDGNLNEPAEPRQAPEQAPEQASEQASRPEAESPKAEPQKAAEPGAGPGASRPKVEPGPRTADLPATLSTLIFGLATTAMIQLGESPPDGQPASPPDLAAAKQTIDILGVLEKKTRGNLDHAEESLLTTLLYDLRIKYVGLTRS
ncbi:MAG: DUF1844 domain-containing protein [Deltaproteobacteria bacterium]|jgi:hypothetical protein|nr:DUF1844 domain-containing protein [Deltaproteobacteria bacterium]